MDLQYDVVIVGAGNAALSAAIAAREQGARTVVLERAPEYFRGGNTYFTGGIIRCAYNGIEDIKALVPDMSEEEERSVDVGSYNEEAFYSDLMRVTNGLSDPELAQTLVSRSHSTLLWLREKGVRFVLSFGRQAFKVGDTYRFWGGLVVESVGAGKGLSDQQFEAAERMGVEVRYQTRGLSLLQDGKGRVCGVRVADGLGEPGDGPALEGRGPRRAGPAYGLAHGGCDDEIGHGLLTLSPGCGLSQAPGCCSGPSRQPQVQRDGAPFPGARGVPRIRLYQGDGRTPRCALPRTPCCCGPDGECRGAKRHFRGHGGVPRISLHHPLPGEEGGRGNGRKGCGAPTLGSGAEGSEASSLWRTEASRARRNVIRRCAAIVRQRISVRKRLTDGERKE